MSSQASSSSEKNLIIEEREEFMVSPSYTGGLANRRIAHFLRPTVASSLEDSNFKLPLLSPKKKWPMTVNFTGWKVPEKIWEEWIDKMFPKYHSTWRKVGILEAILSSKYSFKKNYELILGITERWCPQTNTFVFPWGEASITLEDMMILGGLSILGDSGLMMPLVEKDLIDIETHLEKEVAKFEIMKGHTHVRWINFFMRPNSPYEHEAFLASWLSMFVCPVDDIRKINKGIFPTAIRLARGTKMALAPVVLASLYRDLSLLRETMTASTRLEAEQGKGNILQLSLWSPFHLVQLWVWERFESFQPIPNSLKPGEPRAARWHNLRRLKMGNVRDIIDSSSHDVFQWRPYCLTIDNWVFPSFYKETEEHVHVLQNVEDDELQSFVRCLKACFLDGIEGKEVYQPHRVAMQFGYDQDLPGLVSSTNSSGTEPSRDIEYIRPVSNNESLLYFPARSTRPNVSISYLNWWRRVVLTPVNSIHVARGRRSIRIARTYSQASQQAGVTITNINTENLEVPPTNDLSNSPSSSRFQSTGKQASTMGKIIDLNLPPNFPSEPQTARPETSTERQISGVSPEFKETVGPDNLPNSPSIFQSTGSERKFTMDLNLPPPESPSKR